MDRMYRHQRYFYDLTRKYYLLGRDRLIREMKISGGENILEIGCGTARNLIILGEKTRERKLFRARCFGRNVKNGAAQN